MAAISLALGIAIQNFPEGAIISMPLQAAGMKKRKAFFMGVLSGAVEPIAALLTILAASFVLPVLSYLLSFAAGAMIYVVVEELIPEMSAGKHSNLATLAFALGFIIILYARSAILQRNTAMKSICPISAIWIMPCSGLWVHPFTVHIPALPMEITATSA